MDQILIVLLLTLLAFGAIVLFQDWYQGQIDGMQQMADEKLEMAKQYE